MKKTGESKCLTCKHKAYDGPAPEGLAPLSLVGCSLPSYQAMMCMRFMRLGFESPTVSKDLYISESKKEEPTMQPPVCKACPRRNLCPAGLEPRSYDCDNETVDEECFDCDQINECEVLDHKSHDCPLWEDPAEEDEDDSD